LFSLRHRTARRVAGQCNASNRIYRDPRIVSLTPHTSGVLSCPLPPSPPVPRPDFSPRQLAIKPCAAMAAVLLVASATALLALAAAWLWDYAVVRLLWRPRAVAAMFRAQGVRGPPYSFLRGNNHDIRTQEDEGGGRRASAGRPRSQLPPQGDAPLPHLETTLRYVCLFNHTVYILEY